MKKSIVIIFITFIAALLSVNLISAQTCAISLGVGRPLLPDTDCDGVVDIEDNCPYIPNPMQRDAERNGLGDACDLYIESINTNPADFVFNGRAFNTIITLYNYREHNIRNLKIRVIIPELGIESVRYVDNLEVCTAQTVEFFLRAPVCVPMHDYNIFVEASFMNLFGEFEVIPGVTSIRVVPDPYCQMIIDNNETIGNTFIDVMEIQDVYKGQEAVFPIKISNREFNDKEYIFSVTGIDKSWGYARFEPGSLIIVPSESERIMDLYVGAYNDMDVIPGERVFVVSIQSGEEIQRILLISNVKEPEVMDKSFLWFFSLRVLLIAGLIVLILVGLIIGIKKYVDSVKSSEPAQYY
ncbi:hypothetical protein AYK26_01545 [Euryarchaeota archaeon SM23-78]|nr:MAG: hypothetical protein AYK26_01545 [Euryarchaeota archaeon SM23-78]MBW3000449.1 thrombospondin type 3 repeat-containing protein [Candidatus Woesearchaeota archaeon]